MIKRLERAREWASRLFVSLVIVAAVAKEHVFSAIYGTSAGHEVSSASESKAQAAAAVAAHLTPHMVTPRHIELIYALVLICLYAGLEVIADLAIDNSRFVRKLLMGDEDIEGHWLDIVYRSDEILAGGILYIFYEDRRYRVEGRDFDEKGVWRGWFATDISQYSNKEFTYKYRALRPGPTDDGTGHGEYHFTSGGHSHITQFDGYFFEDRNARRFYVHGERLRDFVGKKADWRQLMQAINIPPLVARFVAERREAMPIAPIDVPPRSPDQPESRPPPKRRFRLPPSG